MAKHKTDNRKTTRTKLMERYKILKRKTPRIVKTEDAMELLGYNSKSAVRYFFKQLEAVDLMYYHRTGEKKGEWYLL